MIASASAEGAWSRARAALVLSVLLGLSLLVGPSWAGAAALVVAALAVAARAPGRAGAWLALVGAAAAAACLAAAALVPAALAGHRVADAGARLALWHWIELPIALLAAAGALAGPAARAARVLLVAAAALVGAAIFVPAAREGALVAVAACVYPVAGVGLSRILAGLLRVRPAGGAAATGAARVRAAIAALCALAAVGPLAVRAWGGLPLGPRAEVEQPPAILAGTPRGPGSHRAGRPRIAWPERGARHYRDAAPDTATRFGFAYLPGRDRARDPELAQLWRASAGIGERLLDLYGVAYVLVPARVASAAAMPVVGRAAGDPWVLAENTWRRPRAFVAPRWTWYADATRLARELFPSAPDQRRLLGQAEVRLIGSGPPPPASAPSPGRLAAAPCEVRAPSDQPEDVTLTCRSETGGYAVLLDRFAPGWTAEVDGRPARIERADLLARAVAVGPGLHQVRFHYRTPGLLLGGALSILAWLNAALAGLILRRTRSRAGQATRAVPTEPGDPARGASRPAPAAPRCRWRRPGRSPAPPATPRAWGSCRPRRCRRRWRLGPRRR